MDGKEFLMKIMQLGADLDKANDRMESIMIINDAEKLYLNHMKDVKISLTCDQLKNITDPNK